jgi:DNA-binding GntR family transcriptional regulator
MMRSLGEPQSRVDQVMGAIRRAILSGDLKPGETFRTNELAATLGVSIIPVREALQRLAGSGLIDLRQGKSARVSPLSADDLTDVYHLRELLEGDAAERACLRLTPADRSALLDALAQIKGLDPGSDRFWAVHREFHQRLIEPVLTPRLSAALEPLHHGIERYVRLVYDEVGFDQHEPPETAHAPLLEAVLSRRPASVRQALVAHYEHNLNWMLAGFPAAGRSRTQA